jgi:hypothetical protein
MSKVIDENTVEESKFVNYLTDFDVEFVSLVDHGSNRLPFKIVREDEERAQWTVRNIDKNKRGEKGMNDVIQSVLVPSTSNIDELKEKLVWLHDMEVQRVEEFDFYKKFNHRPMDAFNKGSFYMERLEGGALALVGELLESDSKAVTVRGNSMASTVGIDSNGFVVTFGDIILRELDSLVTNVISTLSMSSLDSKSKKKSVASALDAFSTYVSMGLDNSGEGIALRFESNPMDSLKKTEEVIQMEEVIERTEEITTDPSEQLSKLLETRLPDAIGKALDERLETAMAKVVEQLSEKLAPPPVEEVKAAVDTVVEVRVDGVEILEAKIKELEERLTKFEEEDVSISRITEDKEPVTRKDRDSDNVFKGLFALA